MNTTFLYHHYVYFLEHKIEVVFWLSSLFEPFIKKYLEKQNLKYQKFINKSGNSLFTHRFLGKGTFYMAMVKRQKCPMNSYTEAS
jgi:hypothetical protein